MKTIICSRCGAQIAPGTVKCPICGAIHRQNIKRKAPARKPRRATVCAVGALALLAAVVVLLCFMGGVFDFTGKVSEKMPNVVGLTEDAARQQLDALGLRVEVTTAPSEEAAGIVIEQSIPEGRSIKNNQNVSLTVSGGSENTPAPDSTPEETDFVAPDVVGELFDAAQMRTESWGLNLVVSAQEYSDDPEGTILSQDPLGGTKMRRGQAVEVVVSRGPEDEHIISVTAGKGGSVSPNGRVSVKNGEDAEFVITPDEGFVLDEIRIDDKSVEPDYNFVLSDVTKDHSLYAVFRAAEPGEEPPHTETPTPGPSTPSDVRE